MHLLGYLYRHSNEHVFSGKYLEVTEKEVPPHEQEFGNTHKTHFLQIFFVCHVFPLLRIFESPQKI